MTEESEREIRTTLTQNTCLVGALYHGQVSLLSGEEFLSLLQQFSSCYFLTLVQNGESRKKRGESCRRKVLFFKF